jgi:hypothetical protein
MYKLQRVSANATVTKSRCAISVKFNRSCNLSTAKKSKQTKSFVFSWLHRWDDPALAAGTAVETWKTSGFQSPAATSPSMRNPANVRLCA